MNIKITADSTCDLSEELLRQWNISLMPMHILMGDDTYLDGVTIHPADVFAHVDAGGQTPKSAAANPVDPKLEKSSLILSPPYNLQKLTSRRCTISSDLLVL